MPQLPKLVPVSTQLPLHSDCPLGQPQLPPVQTCPVGHALPHAPQLLTSLPVMLTQLPLQAVSPAPQLSVQLLLEQT